MIDELKWADKPQLLPLQRNDREMKEQSMDLRLFKIHLMPVRMKTKITFITEWEFWKNRRKQAYWDPTDEVGLNIRCHFPFLWMENNTSS